MPRCILRLQTDRNMTAAVQQQVLDFIDDKDAFFDYILFTRVDQEESDTILKEKRL